MINKQILKWLNQQRKKQFLIINKIDLLKLQKWVFNQKEIYHESKRFFKIVGVKINSNFYKKKIWYQPIIVQNEIGILGVIKEY